ncbi:FlgB family protein [Litorisediminicola beolgyonensis]|uniref:FlgB family protein n=1 Tax=Litorisediminicola beolgyonensis TaxID=1173614 RepID=A0ABW3ZGY4_9RHOB
MFQNVNVFRTAMALARHAGGAQAVSAQNMANADTPGYRALRMPDFAAVADSGKGMRATRPGHMPLETNNGVARPERIRDAEDPNGNTVALEAEMIAAANARSDHDRALAIYRNALSVLRSSLGRG